MKRTLAALALIASIAVPVAVSGAAPKTAHPTYALGSAKKCKTGYAKVTLKHNVRVRVKVTEHVVVKGRKVARVVYKTETKSERYVACEWKANLAGVVLTTTTIAGATKGTATSSTQTNNGTARATIDPSYVQNPQNPLDVTFSYSASDTQGQLANGVLDLFWGASTQSQTLACSLNVGGQTTGGTCEIVFASYGNEFVTVQYSSGATSATETDTEDIENPNPPAPTTTTVAPTTTTVAATTTTTLAPSASVQYEDVIVHPSLGSSHDYGTDPPATVPVPVGGSIQVEVEAAGSLGTDPVGQGSITYAVTPNDSTFTMNDQEESASPNCSGSYNGSGAIGTCAIRFTSAGTYSLTMSYASTDGNYPSVQNGLTETIDVS